MNDPKTIVSSGNTLMDLRLVILRTIAKVWESDDSHGDLRKEIEEKDPVALNKWFWETFDYAIPFVNFGIKFIKPSTQWNFFGDNQWTKPEDETLTVALPALPDHDLGPPQQTELLMQYYQFFPTLFGSLQHSPQECDDNRGETTDAVTISESGTNFHGNDYDLGVAEDSFLSFAAVMTKLIAAAWANPELMKHLNYERRWETYKHHLEEKGEYPGPERHKQFNEAYYHEIKAMLVTKYHFDFPWIFNLKFVVPDPKGPESFWIKKNDKWAWRLTGPDNTQLIRNWVTLEIPQSPSGGDAAAAPIALARYNAIGPAFPFTCS